MIASKAAPGHYVDTGYPCSASVVTAVTASRILGIGRYVPLPGLAGHRDISVDELARITGAGLACWLVQHVRFPGWDPGAHDGAVDAQAALAAAKAAGYPSGAHLFLDLEGITGSGTSTAAFADAWSGAVTAAGYLAGLYVGYAVPLSPQQLYELPGYDCYWSDAGHRLAATRSFAIEQGHSVTIAGVEFDTDIVVPDALGGLPVMASEDLTA